MKLAHDIVIAPVISEKSLAGVAEKRYTFKVAKDSTKVEVAKAVEEIFGVKVVKVNTCLLYTSTGADDRSGEGSHAVRL